MTNAKTLRLALLGGAAIIATTAVAKADDLSDLKAQLATLQSQVNTMQASNAAALPKGVSLITMRKGGSDIWAPATKAADAVDSNLGYTFSIAPTADMPAPTTEVSVSGEVRGLVTYTDAETVEVLESGETGGYSKTGKKAGKKKPKDGGGGIYTITNDSQEWDITERARVTISGKTETSVGEVGAKVRLQGTDGGSVSTNRAYGYWDMSPEWTLMAGRDDSASAVQAGVDWMFSGGPVGNYGGTTNDAVDQVRLTYTSGALTAAVAVEDNYTNADHNVPDLAGYISYTQGGMLFNIAGFAGQDDVGSDTDYFIGAGANVPVGSMMTLTASIGTGEGGSASFGNHTYYDLSDTDTKFMVASIGAIVALSETTSFELGYGYTDTDNVKGSGTAVVNSDAYGCDPLDAEKCTFNGTLYSPLVTKGQSVTGQLLWTPAKQLTMSAGAGYEMHDTTLDENQSILTAGVGAWFRF